MGTQLPKRHSTRPIFGPCLLWPNGWMDQDSLGTEVGQGHIVLDGAQLLPSRKEAHQAPIFGPCLLWPNGRPSQLLLSSCTNGRSKLHCNISKQFSIKLERATTAKPIRLKLPGVILKKIVDCTGGTDDQCAEREPIMRVYGRSSQRGPGAVPLVRKSEMKPPLKLKAFWHLNVKRKWQICLLLRILQV